MARENWGRQNRENYHNRRGGSWQRSPQTRPPPHDWQSSVPHWEKKFCARVGAVPWHKLVDAKKFLHLYPDILGWNDSACEEAFRNAKQRFWAEINGVPCNIEPSDPDIYIDEIDWNPKIHPELVLELEREPVPLDLPEQHDAAIINFESPLYTTKPIPCTGWDDDVQGDPIVAGKSDSLPRIINCDNHDADNMEENLECNYFLREDTEPVKQKERDGGLGDHSAVKENRWDHSKDRNDWDWNDSDCNNYPPDDGKNRGGGSWKGNYKYASPAFHRDTYQVHRGCSTGREGKSANFGYRQQPLGERLPSYWRW
ncbi:hypothetical protein Dimus_002156 [Dionaea muscipula]